MYEISKLPVDLNLGHQEEGKVTQFQVDCTEWLDK
jgi:hypothetical protein